MRCIISELLSEIGEFDQDYIWAQQVYNDLTEKNSVPTLLKPSIYIPCPLKRPESQLSIKNKNKSGTSTITPTTTNRANPNKDNQNLSEPSRKPQKKRNTCCDNDSTDSSDGCKASPELNKKQSTCCNGNSTDEKSISSSDDCCKIQEKSKKPPNSRDQNKSTSDSNSVEEKEIEVKGVDVCNKVPEVVDNCKVRSQKMIVDRLDTYGTSLVIAGMTTPTANIENLCNLCKEEEKAIPIITGVAKDKPRCGCLQNYYDKIKKYEEYVKRKDIAARIKSQDKNYVLGGVVNTSDGPVYLISGVQKEIDCKCCLPPKPTPKSQPQAPAGRIKYGITGVKEQNDGNVFILSGALPIDECECMKVLKSFEHQHSSCLKMYENYLNKIKKNCEEHLGEFNEITKDDKKDNCETNEIIKDDVKCKESTTTTNDDAKIETEKSVCRLDEPSTTDTNKNKDQDESCCVTKLKTRQIPERQPNAGRSKPAENLCSCAETRRLRREEKMCRCMQTGEFIDDKCICERPAVVPKPKRSSDDLKRFAIYPKIPCNYKLQLPIIRKILNSMAEDDFPLPKLPDCHRLPHFRLWMRWRCGKFWTQEEKVDHVRKFSQKLWKHTDECKRDVKMAKLPISRAEAKTYTWDNVDYCREIVAKSTEEFYRRLRQNHVELGREYFPTTASYEFPTPAFRDCFFSYVPGREQDSIAVRLWQIFEIKDFSKRKSCL